MYICKSRMIHLRTLAGISDIDTNDIDNSSVTSESQSIDINSKT